ncbi:MAG: IS66 family insertion sequence element accessory protein TnpB [Planctomycetes bacterium]|nr:IS66 family insertion sequence element accessory protein TnpB [Planctomycetota bacterium]
MSQGHPRDPRKAQFWRDHLRRWQGSGLTIRAYCQHHHLAEASFYGWRRTLAQRQIATPPTPEAPPVTFVPVHVQPEPAAGVLELVFTSGRRLRIPPGTELMHLQAVVAVLEETPC